MNAATQRNTANASPGDSPDSSREGQNTPEPTTDAEWKRFHLVQYQRAADDGYSGMDFDHAKHGMYTSAKHAAYVVGRWLKGTGRGPPTAARPSRGDLFKVSDMTVRIHWYSVKFPRITREA